MQFRFFLLVSIFLVVGQLSYAESVFTDKDGNRYAVEWNQPGNRQEAQQLFIDTFHALYKDSPQVQIPDLREWLREGFQDDMDTMLNDSKRYRWVVAKREGRTLGFAAFDTQDPQGIYVMQMAVHPSLQGRGVGRQLLFSILNQFPDADQMVLITRRMNERSIAFYERFGFKRSRYMRPGYDVGKYIGLERAFARGECQKVLSELGHQI